MEIAPQILSLGGRSSPLEKAKVLTALVDEEGFDLVPAPSLEEVTPPELARRLLDYARRVITEEPQ